MFKKAFIGLALIIGLAAPAMAEVIILDKSPVYKTVHHYDNVRRCTKTSNSGDVLTGAIIGGIIGNNIGNGKGNGAAGAVIGGLIGANNSKERCHTVREYSHTSRVVTGWNVTMIIDGREETVYVPN